MIHVGQLFGPGNVTRLVTCTNEGNEDQPPTKDDNRVGPSTAKGPGTARFGLGALLFCHGQSMGTAFEGRLKVHCFAIVNLRKLSFGFEFLQVMAKMRHPHVVQFLGLCYLEGSTLPVLVMERMDSSLDDLLEGAPGLPLALKRSLLSDVVRGLLYLHTLTLPLSIVICLHETSS